VSDDVAGADEAAEQLVDAADPVSVEKQRRRRRKTDNEADLFWQGVFSTEIGRREMWAILQSGHAFETPFMASPGGFPDPNAAWHRAGEMAYALRLYHSWMAAAPEGVTQMHQEHDDRMKRGSRRKV